MPCCPCNLLSCADLDPALQLERYSRVTEIDTRDELTQLADEKERNEAATFSIQGRDAYSNVRLAGQDKFIVKVVSDECQAPGKLTCQPYGPEPGRASRSATAGTFLTSDFLAISDADVHCRLADNLVKLPEAGSETAASYTGAYAIFVGGVCDGRWSVVTRS